MWEMNKNLNDFKASANQMRSDGVGVADIIDYLIKRVQKREEQLTEIKEKCWFEREQNIKNDWILENIIDECEL